MGCLLHNSVEAIIYELYTLHETRKEMNYKSIYHAQYEEKAIELNKIIKNETGYNYIELDPVMISVIVNKYNKEK